MLRHNSRIFFQIFDLHNIFDNFDQKKVPKRFVFLFFFLAKYHIFAFFNQNFQRILTKKVIFGHFLKQTAFLAKFGIKNGFYDSFPFSKCLLYIHYSNSWKVTALDMSKKKKKNKLGWHPLNNETGNYIYISNTSASY